MQYLFHLHPSKLFIYVFLTAVLFGKVSPVLALDSLRDAQTQELIQAQAGQTQQLPSLSNIAKTAMPAVVNIATSQKVKRSRRPSTPGPGPSPFGGQDPLEEFFRRFFGESPLPRQQRSLGSGFIISEDGYIVTNTHVVGDADKITVRLSDKEEYTAKVIGIDDKTDIALIKISGKRALPVVPLGNSADLEVGDWVLAIGNPFGLEQTVTVGITSAKGRIIGAGPYDDFIQTDASINPGNSGGPLLNLKGEVVGINSTIFTQSGGNVGIGFAIPIDLAKPVITELKTQGKVTRGWLGVIIQDVTPDLAKSLGLTEPRGALVAEVAKAGPAEQAGVERGDVIIGFNDTPIKDAHDLPALVAQTPVGEQVKVKILRGGGERTFTIKLGELTGQQAAAGGGEESGENWGLTVANLTTEIARRFQLESDQKGVVVTEVDPGSAAESAGLRPGDVIEEVNRQAVASVADFRKALAEAKDRPTLLLLVRRGGSSLFFALNRVEEQPTE